MLSAAGGAWQACEVPRTLGQGGPQLSRNEQERDSNVIRGHMNESSSLTENMAGFVLQVVEEVLQKLLRVIVSDPDPTIRQMLVRCGPNPLLRHRLGWWSLDTDGIVSSMVVLVLHRSLDSRFDPFLCQVPTYLPINLGPCLLIDYLPPSDPYNSMLISCCRRTTCAPSSCS